MIAGCERSGKTTLLQMLASRMSKMTRGKVMYFADEPNFSEMHHALEAGELGSTAKLKLHVYNVLRPFRGVAADSSDTIIFDVPSVMVAENLVHAYSKVDDTILVFLQRLVQREQDGIPNGYVYFGTHFALNIEHPLSKLQTKTY